MRSTTKLSNGVTVYSRMVNPHCKTYKQQFAELGLAFNPSPKGKDGWRLGKRARAKWYKTRLKYIFDTIRAIEDITGDRGNQPKYYSEFGIPLDDLKRFVVLMRRLPNLDERKQFNKAQNEFRLWFDTFYIKPKDRSESVYFMHSTAYKLYKSL